MATIYFLSGAVTLGYMLVAMFFLRFWKRTADVLFLSFAVAFALLSVGQIVVASANIYVEDSSAAYLVRLAAFTLIILAVWRKNRPTR
ncbi:DUF5985 family protein [Rhodanobacter sp. T12-5]|uniref:DUF5985 family protein n=1 Tax=Rhodanobacter sp. T12-5 TaxID=2024611 RepID=UPI0011EDCAD3|nr:DUF5985 family protein [Rhodanobacter sp. T12-5]KAA0068414.1 hypothetical protein CIW53_16020 [Rhodanobacter sp. T12-5]